jgi:hypothetical protein
MMTSLQQLTTERTEGTESAEFVNKKEMISSKRRISENFASLFPNKGEKYINSLWSLWQRSPFCRRVNDIYKLPAPLLTVPVV